MLANEYSISEIRNNIYNTNKYVYLDSIDGKVEFVSNKWHFNINAYVAINSNLPSDWLRINMEMPFLEYGPIQSYYNPSKQIPEWVDLKDQCKVYTSDFYVDISQTNINKTEITNYAMFLKFTLQTASSLDNVKINCTQDVMDEFRANVESTSVTTNINYSNSFVSSQINGSADIYDEILINSKRESYANGKKIYFKMDQQTHLLNPLIDLISLKSDSTFLIDTIDTDFKYTINNKSYEFKDTIDSKQLIGNEVYVEYSEKTYFDTYTNEISKTLDGINGFYMSKYSIGDYFLKIKIITEDNNTKYLNFSNNFSFDKNTDVASSIEAKEGKFITDNTYNEENI